MRLHRDERGQTIVLVAFSLPLLLGFIGIATDVGALFKDKRTLQTAADAAAIAAALNRNGDYSTAGQNASKANGFTNGTNGVVVTINDGPTWAASNYNGVSGYYEATVTKPESTIFLALFGYPSVTVIARAVAGLGAGAGCLYTVGSTGQTFTYNGGGGGGGTGNGLYAPGCGLVVESSGTPAMVVHGNANVTLGSIGVVGTFSETGGSGSVTPTPVQHMAPESDPLNYLPQFSFTNTTGKNGSDTFACAAGYDCSKSPVAPGSCASNGTGKKGVLVYNVAAGATLSPGCYATLNFPGSGTVTLNSGLYIVDGDVNFNASTVNGSSVTFYTNGSYNFSTGTYNLTAPNDSTGATLYNGVLFAESLDDTNGITFNGNSTTVIKGIVYAPGASFTMSGNPTITLDTDFVVHDLTLNGNISFTSYDALSGVASPLSTVVLVE